MGTGHKRRNKAILTEYQIQVLLSTWLAIQFPDVIFHCDLSGVRMPIGLATKCKRLNPNRAWPDIFIAEPRGDYHGLFIELKRSRDLLYTKKGEIRTNKHIQEQAKMLDNLRKRGYQAVFAGGFEETQEIIKKYLTLGK